MATFTVTNLLDSGLGSLRNAISQANNASTTDIINFNASLSGGTIGLTSGELRIRDDLTINSLGANLFRIDAGGTSRGFNVDDGDDSSLLEVAIRGLTITGGSSTDGSGIYNNENLAVSNSIISGNAGNGIRSGTSSNYYPYTNTIGNLAVSNSIISGNAGNGIDSGSFRFGGDVTVTDSIISGNTGDGIYDTFGNLTVSNSIISGNTSNGIDSYDSYMTVSNSTISSNGDSGIYDYARFRSELTLTNSTISGNDVGGIITSGPSIPDGDQTLTVTNSTIVRNGAIGIYSSSGYNSTFTVTSSIIAANTNNRDTGGDSSFTSGGNNLIGNGDGAGGFTNGVNGDIVGTTSDPIDPLLGELQENGGPTLTQALLPGSPAIDAGSNPLDLEFDQRGPGFDRVVGAQTDIGAYEVPEPDSTLGVLGVAVLGVVLFRKRQRLRKTQA